MLGGSPVGKLTKNVQLFVRLVIEHRFPYSSTICYVGS